jgi:GH24 family phage-related lysozyme (muramidase)
MRKNDGVADVGGKLFNLVKNHYEQKKLHLELDKNFEQEAHDEEEKRHKELIEKIKKAQTKQPNLSKVKFKKVDKDVRKEKVDKLPKEEPSKAKTTTKSKIPPVKEPTSTATKAPTNTTGTRSLGLSPGSLAIGGAIAAGGTIGLIVKEEGFAKKAYNDAGKVSIGYGHQIKPEEYQQGFIMAGDERVPIAGNRGLDTTITKEQAQKLLKMDMPKYENQAKKMLGDSTWNKLNDNQKAALTDYSYNVGSLAGLKGLKEAIDSGNTNRAAEIIRNGIATSEGKPNAVLKARRAREAELFASNASSTTPAVPITQTGSALNNQSVENKDLKGTVKPTNIALNTSQTVNNVGAGQSTQVLYTGSNLDLPLFMTA